jgi:hypothetical protein
LRLGLKSERSRGVLVPFPLFPNLPDDDPLTALRNLRVYIRTVVSSVFFPLLLAATMVALLLGFALGCSFFGFDTSLSWAVDLVPFTFGVISVLVSIKKLRDEHHNVVIAFVLFLGLAGTVVIHYAKARADTQHHTEMEKLDRKLDSVGGQNSQLLNALLKPTLTSGEAEIERKRNIQKALRSEYILSHDNVSPGLLAGTEFPPADWTNKRLRELGEKWTVATPPVRSPSPATVPTLPEGKILAWVAYGDDGATNIVSRVSDPPDPVKMKCAEPFTCLSEEQLKTIPINLDFSGKTKRRLFLMVANVGSGTIPAPIVTVALDYQTLADINGITISSPSPVASSTNIALEWNRGADLLPYSRVAATYIFALDLEVREMSASDVRIGFRVAAANLIMHSIPLVAHIVRK